MISIERNAPPSPDVVICECFARDGLQHETTILPAAHKAELIDAFAGAGFMRVEATSYSNPAIVPQFADASEVLRLLPRRPSVFYKATCANVRAVERALLDSEAGFGANEISVLVSASESHSLKNLKRTRAEQWQNIDAMVERAGSAFRVIGTVSVAFGCPFEGRVEEATVIHAIESFLVRGVKWVTLGDTTGMATPASVSSLTARIARQFPEVTLIAHFHDTRGTALANCVAAYEAGVRYFDASFGGVGGHPAKVRYGGGYTGNVCTEDLVNLFETMGVETGIDLALLLDLAARCEAALDRQLNGRVTRSGLNPLLGARMQPLDAPGSPDPSVRGING
jgi:hydroxymethylglutaryl-CoA lyase